MGIVVGGGNIWRGEQTQRREAIGAGSRPTTWACWRRSSTALALQDALEQPEGVLTRVQTAVEINKLAETYIRRRIRHGL